MSNFAKGKSFEQRVAGMVRRKADMLAKRNPGSHTNGARRADVFTNLPIHIEAKDQETVKIKEWFEQADSVAAGFQTPVVVFRKDEEVLACLRFNDLLDLYAQLADKDAEIEDLRQPVPITQPKFVPRATEEILDAVEKPVQQAVNRGSKTCRNGHLADDWGYCMQVTCPYSRGYKKPKAKRK